MNIIPESVSFRPSSARPLSSSRAFVQAANILLLAAPPVRLALPAPRRPELLAAPRIVGLLTAGAAPQYATQHIPTQDYLPTWEEIQAQRGCSTLEAMDAEIEAVLTRGRHREDQLRSAYAARQQRRQQLREQLRQERRAYGVQSAQAVYHD